LVATLRRCHSTVRTEEKPGADFRVRQAFPNEPGDLCFLRGQLDHPGDVALADRFPGGLELAAGPVGEGLDAHRSQHLVRAAQLLAGLGASLLPAQPFAVQQMHASQLRPYAGAAQPVDRLW
jgi:hypothetical protein